MNESKIELTERLRRENRWTAASKFKDDAIKRLRSEEELNREEAKELAWDLMADEYLPLSVTHSETESISMRAQGVGTIPSSWPNIPDNASLQSELNWVQANRLCVVEERSPGVTVVYLDRARCPAPSWSALSWLETSIRCNAKFVDILARSPKDEPDEAADIHRERMQLDEIRQLLVELGEEWGRPWPMERLENTGKLDRWRLHRPRKEGTRVQIGSIQFTRCDQCPAKRPPEALPTANRNLRVYALGLGMPHSLPTRHGRNPGIGQIAR